MNKPRFWCIILLAVSLLFAAFLIGILAESFRNVVSAEEFTTLMEEAGYSVEERTHPSEQVKTYLLADCGAFYVEFLMHETMADARHTFAQLRSDLEQLEQLWDIVIHAWSSSGFNSWYEQITSDGQYARMIRIGSTIIFVSTTEENAAHVADIMEMLGQ